MFALPHLLGIVQSERRLEFGHVPDNWWAVLELAALGGLCGWVVHTYRAEARAGSMMTRRMLLAGLRCGVMLLLAAIWLQPVWATYLREHIESHTLVLVDDSASVDIKDQYPGPEERSRLTEFFRALGRTDGPPGSCDRAGLIEMILKGGDSAFLRELTHRNRVKLYTFSDQTTEVATLAATRDGDADDAERLNDLKLDPAHRGAATDVGRALRESVDSVDGAIAGIVVISDGGFNQGESAEVLAQFARARGIAVHAIGVGDPAPARNIRVLELTAPVSAFIRDPFEISARIETTGLEGGPVDLELAARSAGGDAEPTVVARETIVVPQGAATIPVSFTQQGVRAGRFLYRLTALSSASEPIMVDNSAAVYVNVLDNKMRVLLVSGGPTWTYRFLSRLLQRDSTFDVSCWLQSADRNAVRDGDTVIDHLPETAAELFAYDVIVLLDPDPAQFPIGWADLVNRHVTRHGAGLLYCAGRKHTSAFFRNAELDELLKLLPVIADPEADLILNEIGYYQRQSLPVELPHGAVDQPLLAGGGQEVDGDDLWRQLARVHWHYPVKHEKAAATVLIRHCHPRMQNSYGGHVLLAVHYVGAGRATWMGFDAAWRWRRYREEIFNSFWVQNIRYLAEGRLLGGQPRGRIQTDRESYHLGDTMEFTARLTDGAYQPLAWPDVQMSIDVQGGADATQEVVLRADPARPGWFWGRCVARQNGRHVATIRLADEPGRPEVVISHEVDVRTSNLEFLKAELDRRQLITLAGQSAGGAYYELDQALTVPKMIPDRHETTITPGAIRPLWDNGWMLTLLVGSLCIEWALRKRWKLL